MKIRGLLGCGMLLSAVVIIACEGILFWLMRTNFDGKGYSIFEHWHVGDVEADIISNISVVESSESGMGILSFDVNQGSVHSIFFHEYAKAIYFYVNVMHEKTKYVSSSDGDSVVSRQRATKRLQYRIPWQKGKRLVFWKTLLSNVVVDAEGDEGEKL